MLTPFIDHINDALETLQTEEALSDRAIAAAIQLFMRTGEFPENLPGGDDAEVILVETTWLLFLAAPAINARYMLIASMHLNLVLTDEERGFDDIFDELRALNPWAPEPLADWMKSYRDLGELPKTPDALADAPLKDRIQRSREILTEHHQEVLAFTRTTLDDLASDFDASIQSATPGQAPDADAPLSTEELLDQAYEQRDSGDVSGAVELFGRYLEEHPEDADVRLERGILLAALEDLDAAVEDFDRILSVDPTHLQALLNRGLANHSLGRIQQAIKDYDRAIAQVPDNPELRTNRGIALFSIDEYPRALQDLNQAIDLDARAFQALYQRGNLHRVLGEVGKAILDYGAAIKIKPDFADVYSARGFLYLQMEEAKKAAADFSMAISLRPGDPMVYFNRAWARLLDQDIQGAIEDYDKTLEIDPEDVEALANRGAARVARGDLEGALEDWEQAIEINPYYPTAYLKRASMWIATEEPEEAARDLRLALEHAPNDWPHRDEVENTLQEILDDLGFDEPN